MKTYEGDPYRVATILPGSGYTPDMPLLHYVRLILVSYGWTVQEIWWDQVPNAQDTSVPEVARAALPESDDVDCLVVGKSLGSKAIPLAVERNLPGIWLTPLLAVPAVAQAASMLEAPSLFIGSTADSSWGDGLDEGANRRVVEYEGADHSLEIPGAPSESVRILSETVANVAEFVGALPRGRSRPGRA